MFANRFKSSPTSSIFRMAAILSVLFAHPSFSNAADRNPAGGDVGKFFSLDCQYLNPNGTQVQDSEGNSPGAEGVAWEKCGEIRDGLERSSVEKLDPMARQVCGQELASIHNGYTAYINYYEEVIGACEGRVASGSPYEKEVLRTLKNEWNQTFNAHTSVYRIVVKKVGTEMKVRVSRVVR